MALARPGADLVVLAKPQFEAGRKEVSKGRGVIRDPAIWRETLLGVTGALADAGATIMGVMVSPLRGADGNVEFLLHLRNPSADDEVSPWGDLIERAVTSATPDGSV
jgi:23S rRNA (cytidine1920-2'-O)/16S rRNA (cytidine1409-2'-O)-methyltransferase